VEASIDIARSQALRQRARRPPPGERACRRPQRLPARSAAGRTL